LPLTKHINQVQRDHRRISYENGIDQQEGLRIQKSQAIRLYIK